MSRGTSATIEKIQKDKKLASDGHQLLNINLQRNGNINKSVVNNCFVGILDLADFPAVSAAHSSQCLLAKALLLTQPDDILSHRFIIFDSFGLHG